MPQELAVEVRTLDAAPGCADAVRALSAQSWPLFLRQGAIAHWGRLFDTFADFQLLLSAPDGELLAAGHTAPVRWDGTPGDLPASISGILERAVALHGAGQPPDALCALAAMVAPGHRRRGLSVALIRQMRRLAARAGCGCLIAPVRPTLKSAYPLAPMARYARWTTPQGEPFDPWIRVHARLGATVIQVADSTLDVTGSVAEWEAWTGMRFPDSGAYVVPGALQPVTIDREVDRGRYGDPNVWMRHPVD